MWDRTLLTLLLTLSISQATIAQARPQGIYGSAKDWRLGYVVREFQPELVKAKDMSGGYRQYRFRDPQGNGFLMTWGLVYHDTLFLRARGNRFIRALEQGMVYYFKGPPVPAPLRAIASSSREPEMDVDERECLLRRSVLVLAMDPYIDVHRRSFTVKGLIDGIFHCVKPTVKDGSLWCSAP